ncbi:hypothetical protein Acr_03g0015260 [Actinidia rufa]|uniref:NB-ARC domain-containing disease resistance protein n=1 Tax=Actinidia rufa TaxID=165716 RepID=A0A7J0EEJ5_9ERIC|nr:hypothetical protein Acr_03g0015260 [Actinidia rufa]
MQVRDAAREAEDLIDEYVASLAQQRGENLLIRIKNSFLGLLARRRAAEEIKRVKRKFEEIYKSRETFGIQFTQQGDVIQDDLSMRKRLIFEETDVVGLDADADAITERLTKGEARRVVIAVVGMGGIGKTTLARKVYNNPIVVKHFEFRAWVYVSQAYRVRDLLQALVKRAMGLTMEAMKDMSDEELGFELRKYLRSTPYLIVLDDVWGTEFWEQLDQVFANNLYGSRIIITTRHKDVAIRVNPKSPPHNLHFLREEESWELFSKKVFADEKCPDDLEKLGKQMADKCGGLPLAIVVLAGVLLKKREDPSVVVQSVIKPKEEKFLEVLKYGSSFSSLLSHSRRLGLHSNMFNYISSNPSASKLRSMLCFGVDERHLSSKEWKSLYNGFPLLRVLDAWDVGVEVIPGDIHKLIHLRYLMLKSLTAKTLPASISNLWNLQTLVVTAPCIDRPQLNIWKMKELRHLHFHGQLLLPEPPKKKVKDDTGNALSNLLTLSCLSPDNCTTSVLSMMPNLLKLGIHGDLDKHRLSRTFYNLFELKRLQALKLERDRRCNELDSLEYVVFPQSLIKLTIVETQLLEDPMEVLGQLPNLQALKLKNAAYSGHALHCGRNVFPKLQVLKLVNLAIRSWTIAQGAMPSLRRIVINRCGHLEGLPSALGEMPAFQELELWSPHGQVVNEAREIEMARGKEKFMLVIYQS